MEMLSAPVTAVDRELRLSLVGDLGMPRAMNLAFYRHLYEYAAGQLDYERFAPVLASIYARSGAIRTGLAALAYGPDSLPEPGGIPSGHTVLPVARTGFFRSQGTERLYLSFRAGVRPGRDCRRGRDTLSAYPLLRPSLRCDARRVLGADTPPFRLGVSRLRRVERRGCRVGGERVAPVRDAAAAG